MTEFYFKISMLSGEKLDYLLTDATCPTDVVEKAKDLGAYAVSSEWLIQVWSKLIKILL